jgi:hypothetical protein
MSLRDTDRHVRARALLASLGLEPFERFPLHVVYRMSALILDEPVVYGDARTAHDDQQRATGESVIFTASRVVRAVFTDSVARDEPPREVSTVECRTWARRRLLSVGTGGPDTEVNQDWSWYCEWGTVLPNISQLVLSYADGDVLRLPLKPTGSGAKRLDGFLPELLKDAALP